MADNILPAPSSSFEIINKNTSSLPIETSYMEPYSMFLNIDKLYAIFGESTCKISATYHFDSLDEKTNKYHTHARQSHVWLLDRFDACLFLISLTYTSYSWKAYYKLHEIYNTGLDKFWDADHNYIFKNDEGARPTGFDKCDLRSNNGRGLGSFMYQIQNHYQEYKQSSLVNPDDLPEEWKKWIDYNINTLL